MTLFVINTEPTELDQARAETADCLNYIVRVFSDVPRTAEAEQLVYIRADAALDALEDCLRNLEASRESESTIQQLRETSCSLEELTADLVFNPVDETEWRVHALMIIAQAQGLLQTSLANLEAQPLH